VGDDTEDGADVPAGGGRAASGAGGQVFDEAPAGERVIARNGSGEELCRLVGEAGGQPGGGDLFGARFRVG
jgi:hypothetical protein